MPTAQRELFATAATVPVIKSRTFRIDLSDLNYI